MQRTINEISLTRGACRAFFSPKGKLGKAYLQVIDYTREEVGGDKVIVSDGAETCQVTVRELPQVSRYKIIYVWMWMRDAAGTVELLGFNMGGIAARVDRDSLPYYARDPNVKVPPTVVFAKDGYIFNLADLNPQTVSETRSAQLSLASKFGRPFGNALRDLHEDSEAIACAGVLSVLIDRGPAAFAFFISTSTSSDLIDLDDIPRAVLRSMVKIIPDIITPLPSHLLSQALRSVHQKSQKVQLLINAVKKYKTNLESVMAEVGSGGKLSQKQRRKLDSVKEFKASREELAAWDEVCEKVSSPVGVEGAETVLTTLREKLNTTSANSLIEFLEWIIAPSPELQKYFQNQYLGVAPSNRPAPVISVPPRSDPALSNGQPPKAASTLALPSPALQPQLATTSKHPIAPSHKRTISATTTVSPPPPKKFNSDPEQVDVEESAFPSVQPFRAAQLIDQPASAFGHWTCLLSGRAIQDFKALKDPKKMQTVEKMLISLSFGDFDGDNQKKLVGDHATTPIYEAKVLHDLRLIYQIDLDQEGDQEKQILRIWGLESHSTLLRRTGVWNAISRHSLDKTPEYRQRVLHRRTILDPKSKREILVPQTFPILPEELTPAPVKSEGLTEQEKLELHDLVSLGKFIPLSQAVIRSILAADDEVSHIFHVSPREREIIHHPGSAFCVGRSGTGKTTTILFKLIGHHLATLAAPNLAPRKKVRAMFITQSPVLAAKVKASYLAIMKSFEFAEITDDEAIRRGLERLAATHKEDQDLEDLEDEDTNLRGLPATWGELKDEHFPLFLSVDGAFRLLEAEFRIELVRKASSTGHKKAFSRPTLAGERQLEITDDGIDEIEVSDVLEATSLARPRQLFEHYVDADTFRDWWINFDAKLIKGLDPNLVWNGILGTIKGSEASIDTTNGYLSREQYLQLSERAHSQYSSLRDAVYSIFVAYEKRKNAAGDFDKADRTHALIRALRKRSLTSDQQLAFVAIDECQDLLLADATLLRYLCHNPSGWFFAGDTAQTIASGSSFRFEDLKAAVYRQETAEASRLKPKAVDSKMFSLAINYRSHQGITRVGQALVDCLLKFFPESIDRLAPESGVVEGSSPIWLSKREQEEHSFASFLFGEAGSSTSVEFGAEQCILVRNEEARESLRELTGDIGLVMLISEAKGLEFSDVLLWDFFEDSAASAADWRVILNLFAKSGEAVPVFDKVRHAVIGMEIRNLYVAVTRARNNLWFADRSSKGETVLQYLQHLRAINVVEKDQEIPQIAATSSPQSWQQQGRAMFQKLRYRQAVYCFRKAGATLEEAISLAYQHRSEARTASRRASDKSKSVQSLFSAVAKEFTACASQASGTQATSLFLVAAPLHLTAEEYSKAALSFELGGDTDSAAKYFAFTQAFDAAVRNANDARTSPERRAAVFASAKIFYFKKQELAKARTLFEDDESALEFMDDMGFDAARRDFLISLRRFRDAAELDEANGDLMSASKLYSQVGDSGRFDAARCLLQQLAYLLPFGCLDYTSEDELSRASVIAKDAKLRLSSFGSWGRAEPGSTTNDHDLTRLTNEIDMYLAISSKDFSPSPLFTLARTFQLAGDAFNQFMCLDVALSVHPNLSTPTTTINDVRTYVQRAEAYGVIVKELLDRFDTSSRTLRLLALDNRAFSENDDFAELRVLPTSPLLDFMDKPTGLVPGQEERFLLVSLVRDLTAKFLAKRLDDFAFDVSGVLRFCPLLQYPCTRFGVIGEGPGVCDGQCRREHVAKSEVSERGYVERVRIVGSILEFLRDTSQLVSPIRGADFRRQDEQMTWRRHLKNLLYPEYAFAGTSLDLGEANQGLLANGARDELFALQAADSDYIRIFLDNALVEVDFDSAISIDSVSQHLWRAKFPRRYILPANTSLSVPKGIFDFLELPPKASLIAHQVTSAINCVEHIIKFRHDVKASQLIYLVEEIALPFFVASNRANDPPRWHGMLLPRSLLKRAIRRHAGRTTLQVSHKNRERLLELCHQLLNAILTSQSFLLSTKPEDPTKPEDSIKPGEPIKYEVPIKPGDSLSLVLALRVMRLMVFVSSFRGNAIQLRCLATFKELRPLAMHPVTRGFVEAIDWFTVQTVSRTRYTSPLDPTVIVDLSAGGDLRVPSGVFAIRSPSLHGIEKALFPTANFSKLRADVAEFVPGSALGTVAVAGAEDVDSAADLSVEDQEEVKLSPEEEEARSAAVAANLALRDKAAEKLTSWSKNRLRCLQVLRDQENLSKSPFVKLWKTYYKPHQLWVAPFVDIVFALTDQSNRMNKAHDQLKKSWNTAKDAKLDEISQTISEAKDHKKALLELLKELSPTSRLVAAKGSLPSLKLRLATVYDEFLTREAFLKAKSKATASNLVLEDMKTGVKGLLKTAKVVPQTQAKPSLAREDGEELTEEQEGKMEKAGRRAAAGSRR